MSWKTFKLLYCKFTQDNVRKILSELTEFCGTYNRKHFNVFSVHSVHHLYAVAYTSCSAPKSLDTKGDCFHMQCQRHIFRALRLRLHNEYRSFWKRLFPVNCTGTDNQTNGNKNRHLKQTNLSGLAAGTTHAWLRTAVERTQCNTKQLIALNWCQFIYFIYLFIY